MKDRAIQFISAFAVVTLCCTALYIGYASAELYTLPKVEETVNPLDEILLAETELPISVDLSVDESSASVDVSSASVDVSSNQIIRTEEREADIKPMKVIATAYCSCSKCCGVWAENRENGIVYTASGAIAQAGHTIAVDTSVIPFGSVVLIDGIEYVAEDTGSAIQGNRIDIYFDSHDEALQFGVQELNVYVKS